MLSCADKNRSKLYIVLGWFVIYYYTKLQNHFDIFCMKIKKTKRFSFPI
jgi:hypothetical protein